MSNSHNDFDDFDIGPQSDELIPEHYEDALNDISDLDADWDNYEDSDSYDPELDYFMSDFDDNDYDDE